MKKTILFLCHDSSCRADMARSFAENLRPDEYTYYSAGTESSCFNDKVVKVMEEKGIEMSLKNSYSLKGLPLKEAKIVFILSSIASEGRPYFKAEQAIHVGFDDPHGMIQNMDNEIEIMNVYRRVSEEIQQFIINMDRYIK
tara:strand:- start:3 stop:425 length:423 start_codon:yes stop_codon:yes gene_type:complete